MFAARRWAVPLLALPVLLFVVIPLVTVPTLHPDPQAIPATLDPAPPASAAAAVARVQKLIRTHLSEANLPGLSVAVGSGDTLLWAEGFGYADLKTATTLTPRHRFPLGSLAPLVNLSANAALGGPPDDDFPLINLVLERIFDPRTTRVSLGAQPKPPAPGEVTLYAPRFLSQPRYGIYVMRPLAPQATAPELVRLAISAQGDLGTLVTRAPVTVAVLSNTAHSDTWALAGKIAEAFVNGM